MVAKLCDRLVDMPSLEVLNLGHWNCSKYSLLANHNQMDGWAFKYLPQLKYIKMSNVSSQVLQNIGQYCLQLQELYVSTKKFLSNNHSIINVVIKFIIEI